MTAAPAGPQLFSMFSAQADAFHRLRRPAFLFSFTVQGFIVGGVVYFTCCFIGEQPRTLLRPGRFGDLPLIFSRRGGGGGGGNFDKLPASRGNLPMASLETPLAPPNVMQPTQMPKLPVPETVMVAPDIQIPQGGQIGDPTSQFMKALSNGPGGPGGIGPGCCGGIGPSEQPGVGPGPEGLYAAGKMGVTMPQAIYSPEPNFSDEARKARMQGVVTLLVVVGKDGRTYDIRVAQSLGMGLDEQAIAAVGSWRFRPATLNGQPVATQIAVQVDFHLY
jgi:periplasmic protein TonB